MTERLSLGAALIERWFDTDEEHHEAVTDEQILARIESLVSEGWHYAGLESERCERVESEAKRMRNEVWLARQDIVDIARDGWDSTRGEKAVAAIARINDALDQVPDVTAGNSPLTTEQDPVRCSYCGDLSWTATSRAQYGSRVTHKHACPDREDGWCQSHPDGCKPSIPPRDPSNRG